MVVVAEAAAVGAVVGTVVGVLECSFSCVLASVPAGRLCCSSWHSSSNCTELLSSSSYTVRREREREGHFVNALAHMHTCTHTRTH